MIEKIDPIEIVVKDIHKAIDVYARAFDLQASPIESRECALANISKANRFKITVLPALLLTVAGSA
jgi:hypothetical protein